MIDILLLHGASEEVDLGFAPGGGGGLKWLPIKAHQLLISLTLEFSIEHGPRTDETLPFRDTSQLSVLFIRPSTTCTPAAAASSSLGSSSAANIPLLLNR